MIFPMAFRLATAFLGQRLSRASQVDPNFRAALSRDRTIVFAAGDFAHHYVIRDRRITSAPGYPPKQHCLLRFATEGQAVRTLLSPNRVERLLAAAQTGDLQITGGMVTLLWFEGRIQQVFPIGNNERPPVRFDGAYREPRHDTAAARRITREPVATELDPDWQAAWQQRAKLVIQQAARPRSPA